ncbi:RNA 2',3'-cyclic phosphodiesterase [Alteromonas sp. ASW11-36]|uniref:RNA 2',3'-cyclic phosphodiesterase n=1 Tax=Alteromonas arenosi TaxID=3055817 RepID=A0ABT7T228_9ALTE|nr:RNA 2',3'-cyclic phosphodiesterase [Alteromonas sp. ASW11-36]MDM7862279.1 RNA 2',3'-cyclic phosphodiesterase [Alteromonas sp. ASW11-36]
MRCFIGIDLPPALKTQIVTWRDNEWPGSEGFKPVPPLNLHMTLVFIPALVESKRASIVKALDVSDIEPFTLTLDWVNHWRKPAIAWLSSKVPPIALKTLQSSVSTQCQQQDIKSPDVAREYQPHVTLMRKFKEPTSYPQPQQDWRFIVDKIHLFESRSGSNGVHYPIIETWSLG